ncbi:MAG: thiamine phosphate synthase [Candidatus Omnitrophica bacterium]|nr:thiamine phosphate synthase [Candidatus Omnitrophota bacterium]
MRSRKALLQKSVLYVILDKAVLGRIPLENTAVKLRDSGADIVQLRDKLSDKRAVFEEAKRLRGIYAGTKTLFIINDHVDIALALNCDGVHLGQYDLSLEAARRLLGREKIIGISCSTLPQAREAQENGADYIGIGPVFPTSTKSDAKMIGLGLIKQCKKKSRIPFFAIGGIDTQSLSAVLTAGAGRVCVCGAILKARNISHTVGQFKQIMNIGADKIAAA